MSFSEQEPDWYRAELMELRQLDQPVSRNQVNEIAVVAESICNNPAYVVSSPKRTDAGLRCAVTYAAGSSHVTLVMEKGLFFPDFDITIEELDTPDGTVIVRRLFEVNNTAIFRRRTDIRSPRLQYLDSSTGDELDLSKVIPINRPNGETGKRAKDDHKITSRIDKKWNRIGFSVADYCLLSEKLGDYQSISKPYAVGNEVTGADT